MSSHFTYLTCGMTSVGGVVLSMVPDLNELGQGMGAGLTIGGVVAAAFTAFGTHIWPKPYLEQYGYKRDLERVRLQTTTNEKLILKLEADLDMSDGERRTLVRDLAEMTAKSIKANAEMTEKNIRLAHQLLVLAGRQRPGEIQDEHLMIGDLTPDSSGPSILLIEDMPGPQEALKQILGRFHFRVEAVGTLAEGLEGLSRHPDFVILDLNLPDGRGEDLLKKVRDEHRECKVVVVTGKTDLSEITDLKPEAILPKPFDFFEDLLPALGRKTHQEKHR